MRAGSGFEEEELKLERINTWLKTRKNRIQEKLFNKRIPLAHNRKQKTIEESFAQKKPEDIQLPKAMDIGMEEENQEGTMKRSYARVDQCYKIPIKRSKRKCWNCYSTSHYKQNCPYIRCFHCKKLGHVKRNCWL